MRPIRVLVVEDSLVFRELLVRNLGMDPGIEVVASAENPYEARDAIVKYKPDVMTLDIELPRMNGIEFLKKLMPQYPMPVVVISSLSDKVFDALNAGAVDFVAKMSMMDKKSLEEFVRQDLVDKIKIASIARLKMVGKARTDYPVLDVPNPSGRNLVVAIGASTGGVEALDTILTQFKEDTPGVVIVQHMPAGFTKHFADRLNSRCRMAVREAKNGDAVVQGQVLLAPGGNSQMRLVKAGDGYQVVLREEAKVNGHCPSVDVLFESVAKTAGNQALGIILTGMGADGAKGLLDMRRAGARTIGQDESTCVVYGMPHVAYELGAVEYQEKLSNIAKRAYTLLNEM
ncbi:MAG: chemotaxis response regulator protein-glutamate methylesterase [Acetatifactor sp.]|nr:chemotaxis response regulator protein-glutamate methylesterase [Acetatifactor sp.]